MSECILTGSDLTKPGMVKTKLSLNSSVDYHIKLQQKKQHQQQQQRQQEMTTTISPSVSKEYWPNVYERDQHGVDRLATWSVCTLHMLGIDHTIGMVQIELNKETGRLLLSPATQQQQEQQYAHNHNNNNKNSRFIVPIAHPDTCPFKAMITSQSHQQFLKESPPLNPIKVGVSILIQDKYDRVFLTKRASTMRIFPSFWVLPGGHMEKGETFEETGMRELLEETGIDLVSTRNVNLTVFGAYESTYPLYLNEGRLPTDHHTVIYAHIKIDQDIDNSQIKLEPNEVEIGAWVPLSLLAEMFDNRGKGYEFKDSPHNYKHLLNRQAKGPSSEANDGDSSEDLEIHYSTKNTNDNHQQQKVGNLRQSFLTGGELIPEGTVFILKQYLNLQQQKQKELEK
ncbi:NUDIX hydrolase family protein [Cavenderia fasciculata]|uniref:m7GpppN-mRNA hydrolase NUDT17 n=1 Tax=Cavenderia fasciculata TaxID=261658 RepID=F4PL74_CACFS|nr:NUDIX hydrolase family protein [Cavenderia fasciculata]EGG23296.1 NUDIX hydrolase family protein [Cavenderia fasciculata]|eukprot:XP_004361147.1 NUDIX hydrolase family protein [Cavenderia fasciculata]